MTKFTRTTHGTTKATEVHVEDVTLPDTTPYAKTSQTDSSRNRVGHEEFKNKTKIGETPVGSDVSLTVIPLIAIGGLVVIVAAVIIIVCKKNSSTASKSKKDDMVRTRFNS